MRVVVMVENIYLGPNYRALPLAEVGEEIEVLGGKYAEELINQGQLALLSDLGLTDVPLGSAQDDDPAQTPAPADEPEIQVIEVAPTLAEQAPLHARRRAGLKRGAV